MSSIFIPPDKVVRDGGQTEQDFKKWKQETETTGPMPNQEMNSIVWIDVENPPVRRGLCYVHARHPDVEIRAFACMKPSYTSNLLSGTWKIN